MSAVAARMAATALVFFLLQTTAWAISPTSFEDPEKQRMYLELLREIRCVVCQNQSLYDSNAPLAEQFRSELRTQIAAGRSRDEIKAFLVDRYGDFVLYRPPLKPSTWPLWLGPPLLVIVVGALLWSWLRRPRIAVSAGREFEQRTDEANDGL